MRLWRGSVMVRCVSLVLLLAGVPSLWRVSWAEIVQGEQERQLLALLQQEKFIRAREQADVLLRQRPGSFVAHFTLAHVFQQEEGNLPLALYHARQAEQALGRVSSPADPMFRHWDGRLLLMQESILGEMDRREEQLAVLDRHDRLYTPQLELRRIWPLMKLHRFEEASAIARKATLSDDFETRISGYNGLLSIEFERERPRACFEVAMKAVRATNEQSCILNLNTAEAAFAVFDFAEAERLALKSLQAPIQDCPDTAHQHLAHLYLLRADFRRAISAVKDARARPIPRRLRQQFEMVMTAWLVRLLYALGQFEKSGELSERVLRAPDRMGLVSFSGELMQAIYTLDHVATLQARVEQLYERASARSGWQALSAWGRAKSLQLTAWRVGHQAGALIEKHELLPGLLTPYMKPMPPWQTPLLVEVLGGGIVAEALNQRRTQISQRRATEPYFREIEGWIAFRRGNWQQARDSGQSALQMLSPDEVLLRARAGAYVAAAAYRLGQDELARQRFDEVLYRWPTVLRLQQIRLPVKIRSGSDALTSAIASRLLESRRLQPDERNLGFVVDVERRGGDVAICLASPRGRRYACAEDRAELAQGESDEQRIVRLVDAFHETVFAPLIDLTQQDINSLDGSAVRGRADEVLQEVLGR